jgi:hypothetical protein
MAAGLAAQRIIFRPEEGGSMSVCNGDAHVQEYGKGHNRDVWTTTTVQTGRFIPGSVLVKRPGQD